MSSNPLIQVQGNAVAKVDVVDHKDVTSSWRTLHESKSADPTGTNVENNETSGSEEKTLKKPDKMIPCPRCCSMDTKFCYYNNYNVNQPRHYCKNCQRYWTAGGNIRNVPVGAGRRKGKNSIPQFPDDIVSAFHQQVNLTYGLDNLLTESAMTASNLGKEAILTDYRKNGNFEISVPGFGNDMESASALRSSLKGGNITETASTENSIANFVPQFPNGPSTLWPNSGNLDQFCRQLLHHSVACPPVFTMPCHPAVGCVIPGTWNTPLVAQPPSLIQIHPESGPVSPTLGKHLRDSPNSSEYEEKQKHKTLNKYLGFPRTLRIGESEAVKSSTKETKRMKSKEGESNNYTGLINTFHGHQNLSHNALQANPAALSRFVYFRESS